MGSFNATCHLSGMAISENEPVFFLPISYGVVLDTSSFCYGVNQNCHPFFLPFSGKYNGYGNIEDIENELDIKHFTQIVNNRLFNNEKFEDTTKRSYMNTFAVFKNEYNSESRLEFLTDETILKNMRNRENLKDMDSFFDYSQLLESISNNSLCEIDPDVNRIGYILIKKSFFNAMITNHYSDLKDEIKANIENFIYDQKEDDFILENRFFHSSKASIDSFSSKCLYLYNDPYSISHYIFNVIKDVREKFLTKSTQIERDEIKNRKTVIDFIDVLVDFALILNIYANIGKSFYPNTKPKLNMSCLYDFANTLSSELEKKRDQNIKDYKDNNGADIEVPEFEHWQALYIS